MELDNIKLDTTWNDAAGSINNNFSKIKLAISQGVGNSVEIDKEMSGTSENAVQNKVIKAYVDGKAAEAQAAAEQYIQNEVLTYYATTKYVEGLVNDLEKEIDGRGYLTSAAMNGYATKDEIKGFVTKGTTLEHYGITDAVKNGGYFTPDASSPTVGFATTANGWPYQGAAMMIGTKGTGQLRLISTSGNSYIPEIFVSGRYLDNESEWARIITDKNLGSNAIVIDSNGGALLPTDPKAKASYVYGRNGWKGTGPAMIFPHGGYSGLFNFSIYDPQTNPNGSPSLFININYGGVLGQWAQVVTDKNFDTFGVKMGGRDTTGSANDIETSSIVGYTNGMTDTPFTYGNLLTIASNPTYYVAQLAIRANGIFAYRARNDSKVWTDWKTVVDSSNIGDYALPKTGGTINGNLTINGQLVGQAISNPINANVTNKWRFIYADNGIYLQAGTSDGNTAGNLYFSGYTGVAANKITFKGSTSEFSGNAAIGGSLTVTGGITLGNKTIISWDEIAGSGGGGNYLPLTGGTIDGSLTINGGFKVQSVHGHYINFDGFSLTANAGLKVASGYSLSLAGEGITAWAGLKTYLGLGSLAYKDEADVVMAGASYSTGSDLNDVKTAGIYTVYGGVTNAAASGSMITLASANPYYIGQITVKYNGEMYSRSFVPENGGVWSNWRTVIDSVNVGDFTLPKTGGVITGALTVKANFQANANILIEAGSIKFLNQGNIEGVGAIIHKYAGAYNMDQYGNFYAASTATDSAYWNFKRADGTASLYVYGGSGKVETAFDTNLGRYGGSTGCTVNMGNAYNRANTNVYGDFKVIGYPAEFQNGITLGGKTIYSWDEIKASGDYLPLAGGTITGNLTVSGLLTANSGITLNGETINSWDSLKSGWWYQRLIHATDEPIAIGHLSYINIAKTLDSNDNITIEIQNNYAFYMATLIFRTGSTIPNFTLIQNPGRNLIWENGINIFNNLEPNTIYKIDIDEMYAAVTTYNG